MELENVVEIEIDEIDKVGPKGDSAYEVYLKNGGTLSEKEWLESLKGQQGEKGEKGDTGSVKFIVVSELPTENIDSTAIYMVPCEQTDSDNTYEEYIYVNNNWELLGTISADVDMTDYYTKEEIDASKQNKLIPGDNIEIGEDNIISAIMMLPIYDLEVEFNPSLYQASLSKEDMLKCEELINAMYSNQYTNCAVLVRSKTYTNNYGRAIFLAVSTESTCVRNNQYQFRGIRGGNDVSIQTAVYLNIYGNWADNVFVCSAANINQSTSNSYLSKTNTKTYTPTSDYNPATKKYVDDIPTTYTGYDATKTQVLKNINGTLTWVAEE